MGGWQDRLQSAEYGLRRKGRGVALPRPCFHRRTRRSLAPTRERSSREAARLARSANPTRYRVKRGTGKLAGERTRRSRAPNRGRQLFLSQGWWGGGPRKGDSAKVQIGAELLWKGAKGMTKTRWGVAGQSTEDGGKVGTWLCRVLVFIGGQGGALPLPASGARERQLGWHAGPTLPRGREAARLARSANPTNYS